jgi:monoamine oxidase
VVQSYALQFLSQLQPVFPGIGQYWNGRATLDTPARSPFLLGSYSFWKKGQYTSFAGAERERSASATSPANTARSTFRVTWKAADEGARAANEILSDYKSGIFP